MPNEQEPSPFAMDLAKGIEKMISTEESRAVLDQFAKIPVNPAMKKQLAEVTERLEDAIATNKTFCHIDQPLLGPTVSMLKSKGYETQREYYDSWGSVDRINDPGFYIDILPQASTVALKKKALEQKEQERKTLEFAKLFSKGECCLPI